MRIGFNCRSFLGKSYAGIGRYAFNLVKSLAEIDQENEYWLYVRRSLFDHKRKLPPFDSSGNFIEKRDMWGGGLNKLLDHVDLYHSPSPEYYNFGRTKTIVTVHDLIYKTYPQGHTPEACATLEQQMAIISQKADKIICCSQSTIDDLKRFYDVEEDRIRLIYQGVDKSIFYPLPSEEHDSSKEFFQEKGIDGPFYLFVGTIEPRKNLINLLEAMSILKKKSLLQEKLVVVGMKGWMMEYLEQKIDALTLKNECVFLGYVSDDQLRYCYHLCRALVFPSFYEGFGFPIVEALSCGAAVITSNSSSCQEVVADAGIIVDPHEPEQIADALVQLKEDRDLYDRIRERALQRSKVFSFRNTAEQTLEVYNQVYQS